MNDIFFDTYAIDAAADNDRKNLRVIEKARQQGRINDEAAEYLGVKATTIRE